MLIIHTITVYYDSTITIEQEFYYYYIVIRVSCSIY